MEGERDCFRKGLQNPTERLLSGPLQYFTPMGRILMSKAEKSAAVQPAVRSMLSKEKGGNKYGKKQESRMHYNDRTQSSHVERE